MTSKSTPLINDQMVYHRPMLLALVNSSTTPYRVCCMKFAFGFALFSCRWQCEFRPQNKNKKVSWDCFYPLLIVIKLAATVVSMMQAPFSSASRCYYFFQKTYFMCWHLFWEKTICNLEAQK
uniref:Uncharacterized protein n=1 Tax=Opuntia streptacantha TaxID=393608 RepID=A0A7C8ZIH0_OPUST